MGRTKIIFFIIILIIFSFEKTFSNSQFLSKQCIKHLTNNCDTNINITGEYIKSDYEKEKIKKGELFFTPPMVDHAMVFTEDTVFYTFGRNPRDQETYEADVRRITLVDPSKID